MYTLHNLRALVKGDFLLLESDLLYDKTGLEILQADLKENVILASGPTGSRDEVFIEVDEEYKLVDMSKDKARLGSVYGELTGISKISQTAFSTMNKFAENTFTKTPGLDYEYALVGIRKQESIYVHQVNDYAWCEIDDEQHLERAEKNIYPKIRLREE
jgi:2-aminoethylphosphonate-pyruvate transaminase